jgi:mono/diheme cytochrome c family protein
MRWSWSLVAALWLVACGTDQEARQAAREAARAAAQADTMQMAQAAFDPALFDSVTWDGDSLAVARGDVVWNFSCRKCHGPSALGDGGFVLRGDTLHPPSFREPDWRFATDLEGLRAYIFAGNEKGMPHWGLVGLTPRDIDAVAKYIQMHLLPQPVMKH